MPPKIEYLSHPDNKGPGCIPWLEENGLVAVRPHIRSSDWESGLRDPHTWYLRRRLGLIPKLEWSAALSRGSWFHEYLQHFSLPPETTRLLLQESLMARLDELSEIAKSMGVSREGLRHIHERCEHDFLIAGAWYQAFETVPIRDCGTAREIIEAPHFRILATELDLHLEGKYSTHTARADMLLYHEGEKSIYILDAKTTAFDPIDRLSVCPLEFQTQHYMNIVNSLLEQGVLQDTYELPKETTTGGMLHVAIAKPSIRYGMNDRDFEEKEHTLKSGPRKGQVEIRRTYSGEPRYQNFVDRVARWYAGEGEFSDRAKDLVTSPPVNFSLTSGMLLNDETWQEEYRIRVDYLEHLGSRPPCPANYPISVQGLQNLGRSSPYLPFAMNPLKNWPEIIRREHFMKAHRDEEVL